MAGVFRDVTAEWEGVEYTFTPSNRVLRRIEGLGVNVATLIHGLSVGPMSAPNLAFVAAEFLKIGGADVSEDDVYLKIMSGTEAEINAIATWVAESLLPQVVKGKKQGKRSAKGK